MSKLNALKPKFDKLTQKFPEIKKPLPFLIAFLIIIFLLTLVVANKQLFKKSLEVTQDNSRHSYSKEVTPLAPGKQVYTLRTDRPKNPQIMSVELNPLDVKIGEEQILTVTVEHSNDEAITDKNDVSAIYYTDNGSSSIRLKLRRADGPPLTTTWQGIWIPEDTHDHIYQASITAISNSGEFLTTLTFR